MAALMRSASLGASSRGRSIMRSDRAVVYDARRRALGGREDWATRARDSNGSATLYSASISSS
jgi:hypothetical protein